MLKSSNFSIWPSFFFFFFLNLKGVKLLADRANTGVISVLAQSSFYPNSGGCQGDGVFPPIWIVLLKIHKSIPAPYFLNDISGEKWPLNVKP